MKPSFPLVWLIVLLPALSVLEPTAAEMRATTLLEAAEACDLESVQKQLYAGEAPSARAESSSWRARPQSTALLEAAKGDSSCQPVVQALCAAGADPNLPLLGRRGQEVEGTPLYYAARYRRITRCSSFPRLIFPRSSPPISLC